MTTPRQLALPFPHAPNYHDEDFCTAPSNQAAQLWLARGSEWPGGQLVLWGEEGRGKTHLLRRWGRANGAMLLSGTELRGLIEPAATALGIDDADACAEEAALLHLLNHARETGLRVLLTGRGAAADWPMRLPDLVSRLRALTAVELRAPEDELLRTLLRRLLADRQLAVSEAVQDWLLLRLPRSAASIREAACRLDRAALAAGGGVSRGLAAAVLDEMLGGQDDVSASFDAGLSPDLALLV